MKTIKEEYLEILKSAKNLISEQMTDELDQNAPKWIVSELTTYNYFKSLAIQNKQKPIKQNEKKVEVPVQKVAVPYAPPLNPYVKEVQEIKTIPVEAPKETEVKAAPLPLEPKTNQALELHPIGIAPLHDLNDIRKIVEKVLPTEIILDHIPSSNPEVLVISNGVDKFEEALLLNFTRAIDICIAPAKLIFVNKYSPEDFPNLKMIIQSDENQNIQINPSTRLLKINYLSELFKEPRLKAKLWDETKHVFFS